MGTQTGCFPAGLRVGELVSRLKPLAGRHSPLNFPIPGTKCSAGSPATLNLLGQENLLSFKGQSDWKCAHVDTEFYHKSLEHYPCLQLTFQKAKPPSCAKSTCYPITKNKRWTLVMESIRFHHLRVTQAPYTIQQTPPSLSIHQCLPKPRMSSPS